MRASLSLACGLCLLACGDDATFDAGSLADSGGVDAADAADAPDATDTPDARDSDANDVGTDVETDVGVAFEIGLNRDVAFPVASGERDAHVFVPDLGPRPLVVLLHGHGGSPNQLVGDEVVSPFSEWLDVAAEAGLALLIPYGSISEDTSERGWNDCRGDGVGNPSSDDVAELASMVELLVAAGVASEANVFANGHSNGAHMSIRLALERPTLVRAIAAVAAALPGESECIDAASAVPLLLLNGDDDPILPFEGGAMASDRGTVLSFEQTISAFLDRNGLSGVTPSDRIYDRTIPGELIDTRVVERTYSGDSPVAALQVIAGGHGEPSIAHEYRPIAEAVLGKQCHDLEMARVVWAFFQSLVSD